MSRPAGGPRATLIAGVAVFDGLSDAVTPAQDVLLERGRIASIRPAGTIARDGVVVIEGRGMTLVPGLVDVHGHLGNASAPPWRGEWPDPVRNMASYLYAGVTTVLDPADMAPDAFTRRAKVASGDAVGPHVFASGPMFTAVGGHPVGALRTMLPWWLRWYVVPRFTRQVDSPAAARDAVRALASSRPDVIKVAVDAIPDGAPELNAETLHAIVDEARIHGLRVVAHVGTVADALTAADAGVAAWMHGVYKERIPDALVPRFAAAHIPCVATRFVFDSYADVSEGKWHAAALERETVPADVLAAFASIPAGFDASVFRDFFRMLAETREARCDNVRRLHAAGVTILAGSDAQPGVFPGPGLHRELAALAQCGLTPAQALRAATSDAARFLTRTTDPDFGIIAPGKRADLVLVDGDPTRDIEATERVREVFEDGVRLERRPIPTG